MYRKWPLLDLHGKKTDEVFDLVDQFISKHSNSPKVSVMTGKGSGALQKKVKEYLKLGGFDWQFGQEQNGSKNTGVMVISLR